MEASSSSWGGRRVLVTGCAEPLGGAVTAELLGRGADVIGLVRDRLGAVRLPWRIHVLYGRPEDRFRVYSALAIHEIETVFHLDAAEPGPPDQATATVIEAVRLYDRRIPIVTARPENAVPSAPHTGPGIRLGVLRLVARGGDSHPGDLTDAARACLQLAERLAATPELRVEEVSFISSSVNAPEADSPDRRAA